MFVGVSRKIGHGKRLDDSPPGGGQITMVRMTVRLTWWCRTRSEPLSLELNLCSKSASYL